MSLKSFSIIKIYLVPISLVLCTPFIYSEEIYNGIISAKQFWFYGSMAFLFLVFAFDQVYNRKKFILKLNIIDIALLTFFTYFFIRTLFTPYTPILYNTRFLNYSLLLIFYFVIKSVFSGLDLNKEEINSYYVKKKTEVISSTEILVLGLIFTGLIQAIWGLLQLYSFTRSFHSGFKITGTFFNPAPFALYLAAIFPLALGILITVENRRVNELIITDLRIKNDEIKNILDLNISQIRSLFFQIYNSIIPSLLIYKLKYYISLLTVIAIILVLPATMNRASWIGVVAGSLFVFNYRYNLLKKAKAFLHNTIRKLWAFSIVILLIGISGAGLYFLKKGSSDGRLLIWEVTVAKIAEKPLFGHGVARFEAEYNNWQACYFQSHPEEMDGPKGMAAGNTKYCFNEYLEMAAELGIVGLLLLLVVIMSIYFAIKNTGNIKFKIEDDNLYSFIIIPSLISLLICALISFPLYSIATLMVFFLLLAILSSSVKEIPSFSRITESSSFFLFTRNAIVYILIPVLILLIFRTKQQYKAYNTWNEAVILNITENYGQACILFAEVYIPLNYTGSYLQYYGKALYLNGEYSKSIEMLEHTAKYTSDEVLYTTLGDTYKALKRYSEAEEAYRHASFMVPHKLYSRYLLANLFAETGQKGKAMSTAKEILSKKLKVESTATREMLQAMKELIKRVSMEENEILCEENVQKKK